MWKERPHISSQRYLLSYVKDWTWNSILVLFLLHFAKFTYFQLSICVASGSLWKTLAVEVPCPFLSAGHSQNSFVPEFMVNQRANKECFLKSYINQSKSDFHWSSDTYQLPHWSHVFIACFEAHVSLKRSRLLAQQRKCSSSHTCMHMHFPDLLKHSGKGKTATSPTLSL